MSNRCAKMPELLDPVLSRLSFDLIDDDNQQIGLAEDNVAPMTYAGIRASRGEPIELGAADPADDLHVRPRLPGERPAGYAWTGPADTAGWPQKR